MLESIIKILPESVSNQLAAGEVIQRPASVVKELIENSLDAGAKNITVNIKDGGKTLIQVIDDGVGMSEIDARLCFERHATSKIKNIEDLHKVATYGFRGEALAAISAVSQVNITTKREIDEIGTSVTIHGSKFIEQVPCSCNKGCIVSVSNLFYNIPARRRFLKDDYTEFKYIVEEFLKASIPNPNISFTLIHNNKKIYILPSTTQKSRLIQIFGNELNSHLLEVKLDTSFINIFGYITKTSFAKKRGALQYLFVNGRYFKHSIFYRTIINAYENLLPEGYLPSFFIFFSVDPKDIDVNIHPSKIEVLFANERVISQLLETSVKKALSFGHELSTLNFNIPDFLKKTIIEGLENSNLKVIQNYNLKKINDQEKFSKNFWKSLIEDNSTKAKEITNYQEKNFFEDFSNYEIDYLYLKNRYILLKIKSGILIIEQHRAHFKLLFEELLEKIKEENFIIEKLIFPLKFHFNAQEALILETLTEYFKKIGFTFEKEKDLDYILLTRPFFIKSDNIEKVIKEVIHYYIETEQIKNNKILENFIIALSKSLAIKNGYSLNKEEISKIIIQLFTLPNPEIAPDGSKVLYLFKIEEIDKIFEK